MSDDRLWFRPKNGLGDKISRFAEERGLEDNESEAIRKLIEIGYRESARPFGSRLRDITVDLASNFAMFGILALVLAFAHPSLQQSDGVVLGVSLLIVSMTLLAAVGVVRAITGQGEAGYELRQSIGRLMGVVR